MNSEIYPSVAAACAALVAGVVILAAFIRRWEPRHLRERAENGEILLLSFTQIAALYDSAPEKWDLQVGDPVYYPNGKGQEGLLVFMLPQERKQYQKWFDWRLSHGEDAQQFQITVEALQSMQNDLAARQQVLQERMRTALAESLQAVHRILEEQKGAGN